jgi:hypothetical protein
MALFTRFDSVKDVYVDFKCTLTPFSDPRTRQVATVGTGRGGGGRSLQTGRGGGQQTGDYRKSEEGLGSPKQDRQADSHYR